MSAPCAYRRGTDAASAACLNAREAAAFLQLNEKSLRSPPTAG